MANKFKWYVVWVGNNPGIYETWEDCKLQIANYPNAKYKSYTSREDAIKAYRGDPREEMAILRRIATSGNRIVNYEAIPDIITDSIAVDAACSGNPGLMEYQGVSVKTGETLFKKGPFPNGTNNIGEFLALVHGLALLKQQGSNVPVYSDSKIAIGWVREGRCKTKIEHNRKTAGLLAIVRRAEVWLQNNTYTNRIIKWNTSEWGEIPADFGRK